MIQDSSKYDAILVCNVEDIIYEVYGDERSYANTGLAHSRTTGKVPYLWYDDPKLYANNAFGKMMLNDLNNWKKGYSAKVTDFAKWVVVEITHHNFLTGRSASKTFLVVFNGGETGTDPAGGLIMSTANKWRTISGYSQAVSYIKSASSALESSTAQKI
jgi:hypothetical protein